MNTITFRDLGRFYIHYDPNTETTFAFDCPRCKDRNFVNLDLKRLDQGIVIECSSDGCKTRFVLQVNLTGTFEPME